jgi:hypothetical protein
MSKPVQDAAFDDEIDCFAIQSASSPRQHRSLWNKPASLDSLSTITVKDGSATIEASYLAAKLGLTTERFRAEMRRGIVYGVTERGEGADQGRTRLTIRYRDRSWSAIVEPDGSFKEVTAIKQGEARRPDLEDDPQRPVSGARKVSVPATGLQLCRQDDGHARAARSLLLHDHPRGTAT